MRVSLTLKPNSRSDFGFQTHWDSTGATVQFIQPGETFYFKDGGGGVVGGAKFASIGSVGVECKKCC